MNRVVQLGVVQLGVVRLWKNRPGTAPPWVVGRVSDRASVVVVLAGEWMTDRTPTQRHPQFSPDDAGTLAAAAAADTVRAVRASRAQRRVLAGEGHLDGCTHEFEVFPQRPGRLDDRLMAAFAHVVDGGGGAAAVLLISTDTPQVNPQLLDDDWRGADAVLGLSEDGGFWAIGLRGVDPVRVFSGVPMMTDRTGAAQLARLLDLGLSVRLLAPLRGVGTPAAAAAVAARHPEIDFSVRYRALLRVQTDELPVEHLFDRAFSGGSTVITSPIDALGLDLPRWSGEADDVDLMVVSRCKPPVIDLGCGPGRMVTALNRTGRSALGVDMSAVAVATSMSRGGPALHRRVDDRLPAEGRWGTALLIDTNIGIGGDVAALLRRCVALVEPGGLIICEVDPVPHRHDAHRLVLAGGGMQSRPVLWARIGATALARVADDLGLLVAEEWTAGDRVFVMLRREPVTSCPA